MDEIKLYIIKIISVAAVVQIGGLVIGRKSYKKLYQLIGGIFVIIAMISFPSINISKISSHLNYEIIQANQTRDDDMVKAEFTARVADKIKTDIEERFEEKCNVCVDTDDNFSKLSIKVSAVLDEEYAYLIQKYITDSYCTKNDEVIVVNETK